MDSCLIYNRYPFVAAKLLSLRSPIIINYFFNYPVKKAAEKSDDLSTKETKESSNDPFDEFESQVLLMDQDIDVVDKSSKDDDKKDEKVETQVNVEALDNLFQFLENFDEINYVLAGYFNKVVSGFMNGDLDTKISILEYFFSRPNLAEDLIKHVYCKSISSLLSNFLNI